MAVREALWAGGTGDCTWGPVQLKVCVSGAVLALQFCTNNIKHLFVSSSLEALVRGREMDVVDLAWDCSSSGSK